MEFECSRQSFEKASNMKFQKIRPVGADGRADRHTDRRMDGRTDRQTEGWTDGQTHRQKDGRTGRQTNMSKALVAFQNYANALRN
jgi:hypothetical protein